MSGATQLINEHLERLHRLITKVVPAVIRLDKQSADYKEGLAAALFPDSEHLQRKFLGYDSAFDFLAYYAGTDAAVPLMASLVKQSCNPMDTQLFRAFAQLAWNHNIKEYVSGLPQPAIWLKYLKASKVPDYGNLENWYKFYAWLHKNTDPSWSRFLLKRFYQYR